MDFTSYILLIGLEGTLQAAILSLASIGLTLVFGVLRIVNIAHGEFFTLGALFAWGITTALTRSHPVLAFLLALILAPLLVAGIAAMIDQLILHRLSYNPENTVVVTIGILYIIQQIILMIHGPSPRSMAAPFQYDIQFQEFGYSAYKLGIIGVAGLVLLTIGFIMKRTSLGLVLRAAWLDRDMAQAFGISVRRVYMLIFSVGAALAAFAAVLTAPIQQVHYLMGSDLLFLSFTVVILARLGSIKGTMIAALFVGWSDSIISTFLAPAAVKMILAFMIACVLIARSRLSIT